MQEGSNELFRIRSWLREEAIVTGDTEAYRRFLTRSAAEKVWSVPVNGEFAGLAITSGCKIETFYVGSKWKSRRDFVADNILADIAGKGAAVVTLGESFAGELPYWKKFGFEPAPEGAWMKPHNTNWPINLSHVKGVNANVSVKFFDRSVSKDKPFAELDCVGILTKMQQLYLPKLAVAFDGLPETNVGRRWVSVFVEGKLRVEARFDTQVADELGLNRDLFGTPYLKVADLYTPTIFQSVSK